MSVNIEEVRNILVELEKEEKSSYEGFFYKEKIFLNGFKSFYERVLNYGVVKSDNGVCSYTSKKEDILVRSLAFYDFEMDIYDFHSAVEELCVGSSEFVSYLIARNDKVSENARIMIAMSNNVSNMVLLECAKRARSDELLRYLYGIVNDDVKLEVLNNSNFSSDVNGSYYLDFIKSCGKNIFRLNESLVPNSVMSEYLSVKRMNCLEMYLLQFQGSDWYVGKDDEYEAAMEKYCAIKKMYDDLTFDVGLKL